MTDKDPMHVTVEAIWQREKAAILARLEPLERAASAVGDDRLDSDLREQARHEAHRLAGSAGTFGRMRASETARELERLLARPHSDDLDPSRLAGLVEQLREQLSAEP